MIKYKIFIPLIILFVVTSTSYADTINIEKQFDWKYYSNLIQYDANTQQYNISFFNSNPINGDINSYYINECRYIVCSDKEQSKYKNIKTSIDHNLKLSKQTIRKEEIVEILLNPFRYNPTNGQLEKIISINISVSTNPNLKSAKLAQTTANNSLLASGDWYKIKINKTGIFKLTYTELKSLGINNPENIRVFGYGGKQLPYMNNVENYDDMHENPIYMSKGADGIFNNGDFILFYGEHTTTWEYNESKDIFYQNIHNYSDVSYYFLTSSLGAGLKISNTIAITQQEDTYTNTMDSYASVEDNSISVIRSGRMLWGDIFKQNDNENYSFSFPNIVNNSEIKGTVQAIVKNTTSNITTFSLSTNNQSIADISFGKTSHDYTWGQLKYKDFSYSSSNSTQILNLDFITSNFSVEGYLDYICINARENISLNNKAQLKFRDSKTINQGQITKFIISNANTNTVVWDITNPTQPYNIQTSTNGSELSFKTETSTLKEFIAFDNTEYYSPIVSGDGVGKINNQNLHGVSNIDLLIVTSPLYIEQAKELADFHRKNDSMNVLVTLPETIYNEYSSGIPDISAIRNFARMLYNNESSSDHSFKYLLLIGDGSYLNKFDINSNLLLTYQSKESLIETSSFTSDDFFGLLDENEGENLGKTDIGIGRFPVQTEEEAQLMVDKIKHYTSEESSGSWQNQICFIGDDDDGNLHMKQADEISTWVNTTHSEYNINKIYLDAYPRLSTSSGFRYPEATNAINEQIKKGALIIDYVGHGNPRKLSHEEILTVPDVNSWKNYDKLSIFVTASCEVGRYDDNDNQSLGETFVLSAIGAGIAALTTTRVVYSGENHTLNTNFFYNALNPELRLGDVIRIAKNNTSGNINKRNFSLLGDPALKIAIPESNANIEYINDLYVIDGEVTVVDTLSALSKASIAGIITDKDKHKIDNAQGTINISIYDKADSINCYGHTTENIFSFEIQDKLLYKGKASITNGEFEFSFILPKDINFNYGKGKISLYASFNNDKANGYSSNFSIGGISNNSNPEFDGPEISLFMNDSTFINGGITDENPTLLANLIDEFGINTTGNGFGHNITAILDDNILQVINLNSFYEAGLDKYNCGAVKYQFYNLDPGYHSIDFKTWDIYNNSSSARVEFNVVPKNNITITKLRNTPNPFNNETWFMLDHNQPDNIDEITISIYNLMGKELRTLKNTEENSSYNISPIFWDGTNNNGSKLPPGIYIYNVKLINSDGEIAQQSSKCLIF